MPITAEDLEQEFQEEQEKRTKAKIDAEIRLNKNVNLPRYCRWLLVFGIICALFITVLPLLAPSTDQPRSSENKQPSAPSSELKGSMESGEDKQAIEIVSGESKDSMESGKDKEIETVSQNQGIAIKHCPTSASWRSDPEVMQCIGTEQSRAWQAEARLSHKHKRYQGTTEDHFFDFFVNAMKQGDGPKKPLMLLDVGANDGESTLDFLRSFDLRDSHTIHSFEPDPSTFKRLKRRIVDKLGSEDPLGKQVFLHNVGISHQKSQMNLYGSGSAKDSALHTLRSQSNNGKEVIAVVDIHALPDYFDGLSGAAALGAREIDFLKIDTEGFDGLVVKGLAPWLTEGRVAAGVLEYSCAWTENGVDDPMSKLAGVVSALDASGYDAYFLSHEDEGTPFLLLTNGLWNQDYEICGWANIGFLRKDHCDYDKIVPLKATHAASCLKGKKA